MSVAHVVEISATSPQGFEDAIRQGLERANKTLRGVTSAWVKEQRVKQAPGRPDPRVPGQHPGDLRPRGLSPAGGRRRGTRPARRRPAVRRRSPMADNSSVSRRVRPLARCRRALVTYVAGFPRRTCLGADTTAAE
jgi:dodecin